MVLKANVRRSKESLKQQSQVVSELRALVEVLETDDKPMYAHTVRRGANYIVRLEATILTQQRRLDRYQNAANTLRRLGDLLLRICSFSITKPFWA